MLRKAYAAIAPSLAVRREVDCLTITWNVNEQRPGGSPLFGLLRERSARCQAVAVALQEVEVGGSSVALAAAKDAIAKSLQVRPAQACLLLAAIKLAVNVASAYHCWCGDMPIPPP